MHSIRQWQLLRINRDAGAGNYQAVSSLALEADTITERYALQLTFPVLLAKQIFTNECLLTDDLIPKDRAKRTLDYAAVTTIRSQVPLKALQASFAELRRIRLEAAA